KGVAVLVAEVPEGEANDANDLLTMHGPDRVRDYVDSARPFSRLCARCEGFTGVIKRDYLVDDFLLQKNVVSMTGPAGAGKTAVALDLAFHVALGKSWCGHEVKKSRVLFIAGENPEEVKIRTCRVCEVLGIERRDVDIVFVPSHTDLLTNEEKMRWLLLDSREFGPFGLVIVDSTQAYFPGDDFNNPAQQKQFAQLISELSNLPGDPAVLILSHPVKKFDPNNLVPYGAQALG